MLLTAAGYRRSVTSRAPEIEIPPFYVMRVLAAAEHRRSLGLPVYDMSAGQPSTGAPLAVRRAAHEALDRDLLGYTPASGLLELRERSPAITRATTASRSTRPRSSRRPDHLTVSSWPSWPPGAGDTVAVTRPGYPAYRDMLTAMGISVVEIDTASGSRCGWPICRRSRSGRPR